MLTKVGEKLIYPELFNQNLTEFQSSKKDREKIVKISSQDW
jgi:hypothetical protein